jgi:hypothetical protein
VLFATVRAVWSSNKGDVFITKFAREKTFTDDAPFSLTGTSVYPRYMIIIAHLPSWRSPANDEIAVTFELPPSTESQACLKELLTCKIKGGQNSRTGLIEFQWPGQRRSTAVVGEIPHCARMVHADWLIHRLSLNGE